jgi:hypothetical protein
VGDVTSLTEAARGLHHELCVQLQMLQKAAPWHVYASQCRDLQAELQLVLNNRVGGALSRATELHEWLANSPVDYEADLPDGLLFSCKYADMPFKYDQVRGLRELALLREMEPADQTLLAKHFAALQTVHDLELFASVDRGPDLRGELMQARLDASESANALSVRLSREFAEEFIGAGRSCLESLTQGGSMPLVPCLDASSNLEDSVIVANALEDLAVEISPCFHWDRIVGKRAKRSTAAWEELTLLASQMRLIACWYRCLYTLEESPLCDLCYRHRAAKKRCALHICKGRETAEARHARNVRPHYVARLQELLRSRRPTRLPTTSDSSPAGNIVTALALLEQQLKALSPLLGAKLSIEAWRLFSQIKVATTMRADPPRSVREQRLQAEAAKLASISGFLSLWCCNRAAGTWREFGVVGYGFDPYNNLAVAGLISRQELENGFLRQRAWFEADQEFRSRRAITIDQILSAEATLNTTSSRRIAVVLGCSHTLVARIRREHATGETHQRRMRANFAREFGT